MLDLLFNFIVIFYKKCWFFVKKKSFAKYFLETALVILQTEQKDNSFRCRKEWDYIGTYLFGENNCEYCCYILKGETQLLASLKAFQTRFGKQDSRELLSLLCNNEPQHKGRKFKQLGSKSFDSRIVLIYKRFFGPAKKY